MTIPVLTTHRGYRLKASAALMLGGLHRADLVIEQPGRSPQTFAALDYFHDVEHAVNYATAWGRIWIDMKM
jgi:hypothetical protein